MATPIYVDPARADDSGNGETAGAAKKTYGAAYAIVDDGGEVRLLPGDYSETTQGANWKMDFNRDIDITLTADSTAITMEPSHVTPMKLGAVSTKLITIGEDITIYYDEQGNNANSLIYQSVGSSLSLTVDGILDYSEGNANQPVIHNDGDGNQVRTVTINGTMTSPGYGIKPEDDTTIIIGDGAIINVNKFFISPASSSSFLELKMINTTTTLASTALGKLFQLDPSTSAGAGRIEIADNTISNGKSILEQELEVANGFLLRDNTCLITGSTPTIGIQVGREYSAPEKWSNGDDYATDDYTWHEGVVYLANQASGPGEGGAIEPTVTANWQQYWRIFNTGPVLIANNSMTMNAEENAHAIGIFYGAIGAVISDNYVTKGNYQLVIKAEGAIARNNLLVGDYPALVAAATGTTLINNTMYAVAEHALGFNHQESVYPTYCSIYNNILYAASGASYALYINDATTAATYYCDNNCYYKEGGGNLVNIGGTICQTIEEIQAAWAAIGRPENDINSVVADPQFVDADGGDFTPQNKSLRAADGQYIGAVQELADLPDVGNVLEDDTVDDTTGTFINIVTGYVSLGETWGEDGTEFTGTVTGGHGLFFITRRRYS